MTLTRTRSRRWVAVAALASAATLGLSACGGDSGSSAKSINLVEYSVPKPAYDALATAFKKTSAGKGVTIRASYGPSGTQSKNVAGGQKADYVGFSVEPDMTKLVPAKVAEDWNSGPTKGIVSDSVVVIVVRKGNPLGIKNWDDLVTKSGVKIVTPSPSSSGSAKWNILAAWSHVTASGGTEAQATAYLKKFYSRIVSKAQSGSVATQQFEAGTGNVLISYENEAITARAKGADLDYIVPPQTVLIQNPAAVTKKASTAAKDFLKFVLTDEGQQIFASTGFRPVTEGVKVGTVKGANDPSNPFPTPEKLVTVDQLGGWKSVNEKFFGDNGIDTKIEGSS